MVLCVSVLTDPTVMMTTIIDAHAASEVAIPTQIQAHDLMMMRGERMVTVTENGSQESLTALIGRDLSLQNVKAVANMIQST